MKAVQVPKPGGDFEVVEREIAEPGLGQVRIRVQACGLCDSDVLTREELFPGIMIRACTGMKYKSGLPVHLVNHLEFIRKMRRHSLRRQRVMK